MVLRTARKGPNAGSQFWGCPRFPSCRGTRNLNEKSSTLSALTPLETLTLIAVLLVAITILLSGKHWHLFGRVFVVVPTVIDGDTIRDGGIRIRLHGIDAPESAQSCKDEDGRTWSCGDAATDALRTFIGGSEIECRQTGTDRYGRIVAICYKDGIDINAWLVRNGWAVAYLRYSLDYLIDEVAARFDGLGIWAGDFMNPERWRHRR